MPSYVVWLYFWVTVFATISLLLEPWLMTIMIPGSWISLKKLLLDTLTPKRTMISNESTETPVCMSTKPQNNVAMLYYLADSFTKLSKFDQYHIGQHMDILTEEDAFLPMEDMEDLIFDEVVEENRYVELMEHIHDVWTRQ
jgi:hypothetical protein